MPRSLDSESDSQTLLSHGRDSFEKVADEELILHFPQKRRDASITVPLIFHLGLVALYTTLFFAFWERRCHGLPSRSQNDLQFYSPGEEGVKWGTRQFDAQLRGSNRFRGSPRPELDDAWNDLIRPINLRVEKNVLGRINRTSVSLADGSGYLATMEVYHQLHCLKYVRRSLHREHYNMTGSIVDEHVDHCLDSLRQYVMCNADVALVTYDWLPNYRDPWANFDNVHKCVDWKALEDWALAHSFTDGDLLQHPNYNPDLPPPLGHTHGGHHG
ncbi:Transacylase cctO-like protein [Cladobotryum mycophilum]|uniref:Transacylase cctO-like protein n=1 Tax=Cladobotryum mycophilum TaxID=491253 RepID=A0ABR0SAP9_9HYPO